MPGNSIVVVGGSNTDMIVRVARLPRPGETVLGGAFATAAGGKGANQAVGAARAGGRVRFIARVGRDAFGAQSVRGFIKDGIDADFVFEDPIRPSGVALIVVAEDGENSIAVAPGANAGLSPADIRTAARAFDDAGLVLLQLETPLETVRAAAGLAAGRGIRIILNPAPARALPASLLGKITVLTPNENEAETLTGIRVETASAAEQAALKLRNSGVGIVVMTLGPRGAFVSGPEFTGMVPGFKVKPVDTTAAGDVFNGALAAALSEDRPLVDAVRFANAAAAISVTRPGAQPSAPARAEIDRMLGATPAARRASGGRLKRMTKS
jgi:ribokinase